MAGIDAERVLAWGNARDGEIENLLGRAGAVGSITVGNRSLTRGVNVRLQDGAREAGGLSVTQTAFSDISARVDLQTINRAARYGDPGEAHQYSAKTDAIFRRMPSKNVHRDGRPLSGSARRVRGQSRELAWLRGARPRRGECPNPDRGRPGPRRTGHRRQSQSEPARRRPARTGPEPGRPTDYTAAEAPASVGRPPGASPASGLNLADPPIDVRLRNLQEEPFDFLVWASGLSASRPALRTGQRSWRRSAPCSTPPGSSPRRLT